MDSMTVTVTKPDGTTETLGPFTSDDTGGTFTTYTPDALGNYTFQMNFAGQTLAGNNLAPEYHQPDPVSIGDYFQPSISNVFKLTVQQEQYHYAGSYPASNKLLDTPNIRRKQQLVHRLLATGLVLVYQHLRTPECTMQVETTIHTLPHQTPLTYLMDKACGIRRHNRRRIRRNSETGNYYSTSQYEPKFAPIIMQGILYYTMYPGASSNPAGWAAVDLHTGQTIWTKNTTEILSCGQLLQYDHT